MNDRWAADIKPLLFLFVAEGNFLVLSIEPTYFCFNGCWVFFFSFFLLIEHSVSKQLRP